MDPFERATLLDPLPWLARELGLIALLVAGFAWREPGPERPGSAVLAATTALATGLLAAIPSLARAVGASVEPLTGLAALAVVLGWASVHNFSCRRDWLLPAIALVGSATAVGLATRCAIRFAAMPWSSLADDLDFGAPSIERAALDVACVLATTAGSLFLARRLPARRGIGIAHVVAGVVALTLTASHADAPLASVAVALTWMTSAAALHMLSKYA